VAVRDELPERTAVEDRDGDDRVLRVGQDRVLVCGDLRMDARNFRAWLGGELLDLRVREFELLAALAARPGELMTREELAEKVWGAAGASRSRTIDVHVGRVRAALSCASSHEYVRTVRGRGYRFVRCEGIPGGD
jgi:DNA-binding response OmpR family regulator